MVNLPLQALWAFLKNPKVLVIIAVLSLAGGAFWGVKSYVADVSSELAAANDAIHKLSAQNAAYISSIKSKDDTIEQVKQRLEDVAQANEEINQQKLKAEQKMSALQAKLDDLTIKGKTPSEKAATIQKILLNEIRCVSAATGGGAECDLPQ